MEILKDFFQDGIVLNIISFIAAIISIIIPLFNYFSSKKKKPRYVIKTLNLIDNTLLRDKELRVLCCNKEVQNLSVTRFLLWNKGKKAIYKNDLPSKEPFKINIKDNYKIYQVQILKENNFSNNFKVTLSPDKQSVVIDFEFIEHNDGINLQILHSGKSSSDFELTGKIIGGEKLRPSNTIPIESQHSKNFNDVFEHINFIRSYSLLGFVFFCFMGYHVHKVSIIPVNTIQHWLFPSFFFLTALFTIIFGFLKTKLDIPSNLDIEEN